MPDLAKNETVNGDHGASLPGFAKVLAEAAPHVFGTVEDTLALFEDANGEFNKYGTTRLTDSCTHAVGSPCWAVKQQVNLNYLFNRRGVEVVQVHRGSLHFRTVDMDPDDLQSDQDVMFLGVYLWFLRQHYCIAGVVVSTQVLAPRHSLVFGSLLKLTPAVGKVEICGCDPLKGPSTVTPEQPRLDPLSCLSHLTELGLASMHLSSASGTLLVQVVESNASLKFLILIDIQMGAATFSELIDRIVKHSQLADFRLKMSVNEPVPTYTEALSRLGKSGVKRLHLHLDCDMIPILRGLADSATLNTLVLEAPIVSTEVLGALADLFETCRLITRLKVCVDFQKFPMLSCAADHMRNILLRNSLQYLVLSGSRFVPEALKGVVDGLALNRSLKELHLDDCQLSCVDAGPFLRVVKERPRLTELNFGFLEGTDHQQVEFLQMMMRLNVSINVTCVYQECQMALLQEAAETSCMFSKISTSYKQCNIAEPFLRSLRSTVCTLTSLCIDTPQVLSPLGGQFVTQMIRASHVLRVLRLRCPTTKSSSMQLMRGLAESTSVAVLTLERWDMSEGVQRRFIDMLRQNRTLHRLEFYVSDMSEYALFKSSLLKGLAFSSSVTTVKIYQGPDREEAFDHALLPLLQRNEMLVNWAIDDIIKEGSVHEGAVALDWLKHSGATLDVLARDADFSPRTSMNRLHASRMNTRSASHALRQEFLSQNNFEVTVEGREEFTSRLDAVRDEVDDALKVTKKGRATCGW